MKQEFGTKIKVVMERKKAVAMLGILFMMLFAACAGDTGNGAENKTENKTQNKADVITTAESGAEDTGAKVGSENAQSETAEDVKQQDAGKQDTQQQVTYWLNRHGEIYDSVFAPAGLDETFAATLWISTHEGEILGENVSGSDYPCIAESEKILQAAAEGEKVWDMPGEVSLVWVRMEQEALVLPEGSLGQVTHKDYIIYREGEDAYVGLQSVEDRSKWTVSRIAGYGEWLERELGIFVHMTTGLGLEEAYKPMVSMRDKYYETLFNLCYLQRWPDGTDCGFEGGGSSMADNTFAILDVDGDGAEELVIKYFTSAMAWKCAKVYGFDENTGNFYEELWEFPFDITFYDNGIVTAGLSHNHGPVCDSLWPYTVWQYNEAFDSYELVCTVYGFDQKLAEELGIDTYPKEVDTDNYGTVYYIMREGIQDQAINRENYEKWYQETIGEAGKIEVPYQKMTDENIEAVKKK